MDNKIIIRTASAADAPALLKIYRPYVENTAITFEYDVPSTEEFASRIEHTLKKYPYLVAEEKGALLGYAYAGPFHERPAYDWAVETSIYVDQSLKHRGIGRRLHDERIQQIVFLKDKPKLFFTEFRKLFFPQFCDIGISVINMSRCHPVNG